MAMSEYLREIRGLVGFRRLLLTAATAVIRDDGGNLLLGRSAESGLWGTIGGIIEPFESPAEAARREAMEEVCAEVDIGPLLGTFGGPGYEITYSNGHLVSYIIIAFSARLLSNPRPDGEELVELGWFAPSDLPVTEMGELNRLLLSELGFVPSERRKPVPLT